MGRQSRARQQRRSSAAFTVLSPGMLEVLSVGKGDLKIEVGRTAKDRARAKDLIEEMLAKGYTLFVETADGPLKVKSFDPGHMVYVVADSPGKPRQRKPRTVPVAKSRTTAVGRTAGG